MIVEEDQIPKLVDAYQEFIPEKYMEIQDKVSIKDQRPVWRLYKQLSEYNSDRYPDSRYMAFLSIRLAYGLKIIEEYTELANGNLKVVEDKNVMTEISDRLRNSNNEWDVISEIINISAIASTHKYNTYLLDEDNVEGRCPDFVFELSDNHVFVESKRKNYAVNNVPPSPQSNISKDISSSKFDITDRYNNPIKLFQIHVPYLYKMDINQILSVRNAVKREMKDSTATLLTSFGPMMKTEFGDRVGFERWLINNNYREDLLNGQTYKRPELDWNITNYYLSKRRMGSIRKGVPEPKYIFNGMPMYIRRNLYQNDIPQIRGWCSEKYKKFKQSNKEKDVYDFYEKI